MKNKIDINRYLPINTKDKIDLICNELDKIQNLQSQVLHDLALEVKLRINKLKIQLYFNERVDEIAEKLEQTVYSKTITKQKQPVYSETITKQEQTVYSETITDDLIITIFIGREISVIENNYPRKNNLRNLLAEKGYKIDVGTTLKMDMIKAVIPSLRALMINNPKKIPTSILEAIEKSKLSNDNASNKSKRTKRVFKKPIARERKYGPDCLPVPRAFIHNDRPGDAYGREGNWYKVINIRSR